MSQSYEQPQSLRLFIILLNTQRALTQQSTLLLTRRVRVIGEATVRLMDGAAEHPRMDLLRVAEQATEHAYARMR